MKARLAVLAVIVVAIVLTFAISAVALGAVDGPVGAKQNILPWVTSNYEGNLGLDQSWLVRWINEGNPDPYFGMVWNSSGQFQKYYLGLYTNLPF